MTELEEKLLKAVDKFKDKIEQKPEYREELKGWKRMVFINAGDEKYHFLLEDAEVKNFSSGDVENADISLVAEKDVLIAILDGEMSVPKAFAKKMFKLNASFSDMLKLRNFF